VRKEQKIREGYVPQEDVGAFRGRRQLEADARRGVVPGANGRAGVKAVKENPFAADPASKSKAAAKNDKRKTKRAELRSGRNWDSDDSEDDAEATRKAIEALSVKDTAAFPPLSSSPKKEATSSKLSSSPTKPTTSAWKPIPAAPPPAPAPSASTSTSVPARAPNRRQPSSTFNMQSPNRKPQKPHPIQGGRIGPCGLAHPPPIEPSPARPPRRQAASMSVADRESTWRRNAGTEPPRRQPSATEPRVRQPVRMREGTGGPLADRVRSLLMQNASPDRPRRASPSTPGESK
jgi:hypothetical protein